MTQLTTQAADRNADDSDAIVSVRDLQVEFPTALGMVRALNGVSFDVPRGKVIGIVGESGCGKSVTARAIMQIIERPGRITGGSIEFRRHGRESAEDIVAGTEEGRSALTGSGGVDIARLNPNSAAMRRIRGGDIAMIFQEPMTSLNPVYTVGSQIQEAILLHQTDNKDQAWEQSVDMLRQVGMPNPERIAKSYPHELSGGMRQRAMIAMALSCHPALLIADEPTTALDVTTEAQILSLMRQLKSEIAMSIMFITHSMGVVAQLCDEVIVMYLGRVVERASVDDIFYNPKHPYTRSLLRSIPRIGAANHQPLEVIKGSIPDPYVRVTGCTFHPRCPDYIGDVCKDVVPEEIDLQGPSRHGVRCHLFDDLATGASGVKGEGGAARAAEATETMEPMSARRAERLEEDDGGPFGGPSITEAEDPRGWAGAHRHNLDPDAPDPGTGRRSTDSNEWEES